jgi:AraC family transcriptional regulator
MIITLKSDAVTAPTRTDEPELTWNASHIMLGANHEYYWKGAMPLSIKCFFDGTGFYNVGAGNYAVDENAYLILNHSQDYSITIEAKARVSSFIIFFETGFAEEVHRSLVSKPENLLDEPKASVYQPINFFQKTYPHDDLLSPALFQLRHVLAQRKDDHVWIQERLHEVMQRLFQVHRRVLKDVEALPAARAATREEIYRRVYRAKDFIYASLSENITLEDMARAACLSPNHFLRSFKQVFGQSPHQYLTALRLEKARTLLTKTNRSVTDICMEVGFDSLGSFSWLFRRRLGLSPENYRKQKR